MKQVAFVDVDDTLVRTVGTKRIPMPGVISKVRSLADAGVELYCWSTAGAEYARRSAEELKIDGLFAGFLPKPTLIIDDQAVEDWRATEYLHPSQV